MRRAMLAVGVLIAAFAALAAAQVPAPADDLETRIRAALVDTCLAAGYPGVTAAVVMPDGRVVAAAAGWADAAHAAPLSPASRMPAGSIGKTFVAAVVLQAVDDGTLDLDARIDRWLGREAWFARLPNAADLTLRLLLGHRSGIPEVYESKAFVEAIGTNLDRTWTPEDLVAFVLGKKPRFRAGAKYFYTDMNYVIAGLVFERATGTPLFRAVEDRLLRPLGLAETVPSDRRDMTAVVSGALEPSTAKAFHSAVSLRDGAFVFNAQAEYAGGGVISTSRDLARWAKALYEGRAISQSRLDDMLHALPSDEHGITYGLGAEVTTTGAGPAYGHDGWMFGYLSQMLYFPDFKVAGAMQINSDPMKRYRTDPGTCLSKVLSLAIRDAKAGRFAPARREAIVPRGPQARPVPRASAARRLR